MDSSPSTRESHADSTSTYGLTDLLDLDQMQRLLDMGCEYGQGNLLCSPVDAEPLGILLQSGR